MKAKQTLVGLLRDRAAEQPLRPAFTFLPNGESEETTFDYAGLDHRARALAAWLTLHSDAGNRVLVLSPSGPEFVSSVFGCLYRGAVAVPAYPLHAGRMDRVASRLIGIVKDARPALGLTTSVALPLVDELVRSHPDLATVRWVATESIPLDLAGEWKPPDIRRDTLAILQYTSGSSSAPKGVMVSHHNILENEKMIQEAHGYSEDNTFVGWIPLAHDWGLINNVFQALFCGAHSVLMPPETFLQKPVRWLKAISRYRNVTSGGPGFAYDLCVDKIKPEDAEGLRLENWIYAGIGASPVRTATLERFSSRFGRYGFHRSAFYCGYGLAEATLLVSDSSRVEEPRILRVEKASIERHRVVLDPPEAVPASHIPGCGCPPSTERVMIVDPESRTPCLPGNVGEIWVSGGNVTRGYWNNPEATAQAFHAFLAASGEGPFLRTGDLGFLDDGELFVTGRLKDLIIVRGRNLYPEDIELTVERCHPGLRPGCTAAFSIHDDFDERLVIVQEVRAAQSGGLKDIINAVRNAVLKEHDVVAHSVVLVREKSVPKTSSGKLQRSACRSAYLSGSLDVLEQELSGRDRSRHPVATQVPRSLAEKKLAAIWSEVLHVDQIGLQDRFFDLGGDSLLSAQCSARIAREFGLEQFAAAMFLGAPTLGEMAKAISDPAFSEQTKEVLAIESDGGGVPLILIFPGSEYRGLVRRLGSDRRVFGIRQTHGRNLAPPYTIEQIASDCVKRLRRYVPHGPYAFSGWCAAGVVALEMARQLEAEGEEVIFVALFDARDILLLPMNPALRLLVRCWRFLQRIASLGAKLRGGGFHSLGTRAEASWRELNAANGKDPLVQALRRYQPKSWSGRILHLWAMEGSSRIFRNPNLIWGPYCPNGFAFHEVPGDHLSMLHEPNVGTVTEILASEFQHPRAVTRDPKFRTIDDASCTNQ